MRRYESTMRCPCQISPERITTSILRRDIEGLRNEVACCSKVQAFKTQWDAYKITPLDSQEDAHCELLEIFRDNISFVRSQQGNIKIDRELKIALDYLYAFASEEGKATLSGEGGAVVGKKSYWEPIIKALSDRKDRRLHVISIGGGIGYDAAAIAAVLKSEGFNVQSTTVVDPNSIAAFLSVKGSIDFYYNVTSEEYFSRFFSRENGDRYLFHLGTTLNVVPEDQAEKILREIAENMQFQDIFSLVMVSEKQFRAPKVIEPGRIVTAAGFSIYSHAAKKEHYKNVIKDPRMFKKFMKEMGLEGDWNELKESSKSKSILFVTYKALKEDSLR